ncbi:unnamed protein product [Prorocentrum cordatum]|uniref:Uncharacterized protein n=1 Tax=Prorocentrum cordatum TaxID=2364126 RepID=A0ABN9U0W0_9DINO|nr:unnamed protein product [Polarella glacialis]
MLPSSDVRCPLVACSWSDELLKNRRVRVRQFFGFHPRYLRFTRECERYMRNLGRQDWAAIQAERKDKFLTATSSDTRGKWNTKLLNWKPFFRTVAQRPVGRHRKRWGDRE